MTEDTGIEQISDTERLNRAKELIESVEDVEGYLSPAILQIDAHIANVLGCEDE